MRLATSLMPSQMAKMPGGAGTRWLVSMRTHLLAWAVITMWLLAVGQPGFQKLKLLISW
jgi:hypothetical protein